METREEKIKFLKEGEKALAPHLEYGDLSGVSDEELDLLVEELEWIWK